jgi:GT2 family glycosyltransferase
MGMSTAHAGNPRVTVIVVPRESFAHALRSLESLYEAPGAPFELTYVDGGMPRSVRRAVEREGRARGFGIVSAGRYATPNHARNVGLRNTRTEYAVIVDNDVLFEPDWLVRLLACADETGADLVGPLLCIGDPPYRWIHSAGGDVSVEGAPGAKRFTETHRFIDLPLTPELRAELVREEVGLVEFHCMLVRSSVFQRVGLLDEKLVSAAEHADFCWSVRASGGRVALEPSAVVNQLLPLPFPRDLASLPFFINRWSVRRNRQSLAWFGEKYGIAPNDAGIAGLAGFLAERRRLLFEPTFKKLRDMRVLRPALRVKRAIARRFIRVAVR